MRNMIFQIVNEDTVSLFLHKDYRPFKNRSLSPKIWTKVNQYDIFYFDFGHLYFRNPVVVIKMKTD